MRKSFDCLRKLEKTESAQYSSNRFVVLLFGRFCVSHDFFTGELIRLFFLIYQRTIDIFAKCGRILENIAKDYEKTKQV